MLLLKIAVFAFLVVVIPLLTRWFCYYLLDQEKDDAGDMQFLMTIVMALGWFLSSIIASNVDTQTQAVMDWQASLSSLTLNSYIQSQTSKTTVTNSTVTRYDYFIKGGGTYKSYWVDADDASVKLEDGALRIVAYKQVDIPNFFTKYLLPDMGGATGDSYIFYVDPQYAKDHLGIKE